MSVHDLDLEKSAANYQPLTPCAFAELPKTSTGKIQKFKLRELAREVR